MLWDLHGRARVFRPAINLLIGRHGGRLPLRDPTGQKTKTTLNHPRLRFLLGFGLISVGFYFVHERLQILMTTPTARVVLSALSSMGMSVTADFTNGLRFLHENFSMEIVPSCSGLNGISVMMVLLTFVFVLDWKLFSFWDRMRWYLMGAALMFALNIFRIVIIFGYAATLQKGKPPSLSLEMLHMQLGWALYSIGMVLFVFTLYRNKYTDATA